jgi:hypothetical protein
MLTAAQAAVLNNKLALQLKSIGDTMCPPSTHNTEGLAWDYYVANKIEAYGKKAKDAARKAAIKAGVMFDHEKEPHAPTDGEAVDVYSGDVIRISLQVKNGAVSIDGKAFYEELMKNVLDFGPLITAIYEKHHKTARPAHSFTATLLSE